MLRLTIQRGSENMGAVSPLGKSGAEFSSPVPNHARGDSVDRCVQGTHALFYELTSSLSLASFASGVFLGRIATASFLSGCTSWSWGTALGAQAIGVGTEMAAMTLTHRLGAKVFYGAQDAFNPREITQEMLWMMGPLTMLRASHQIFAKFAPVLATELGPRLGRVVLPATQLTSDALAVMAAHGVQQTMTSSEPIDGASLLYSGLLTVAQMRVSNYILSPLTSKSLDPIIQYHEQRLRSQFLPPSRQNSSGDFSTQELVPLGPSGRGKALQEAWDLKMQMKGDEKTPTSPLPRVADSEPPPSSERGDFIKNEIKERLEELNKEAASSSLETRMQRAAKKLHSYWERARSNPEEITDQRFQQGLSELKEDLNKDGESHGRLQNSLQRFLGFLDQVSNPSEPVRDQGNAASNAIRGKAVQLMDRSPAPLRRILVGVLGRVSFRGKSILERIYPSEVQGKSADATPLPIEEVSPELQAEINAAKEQTEFRLKQGAKAEKVLQVMDRLQRALSIASKRGLADSALINMNSKLLFLKNAFPGLPWETISWAQETGALAPRRNGALMGLVMRTPTMKLDTTLARRLRGESTRETDEVEFDRELEVLQLSLMLGAGWRGSLHGMNRVMDRLIEEYGIYYRSASAAQLAAEVTNKTVVGKISQDEIMDYLIGKSKDGPLEGVLVSLKEAIASPADLPTSMYLFSREGGVENYFLSSLGVALRSSGSTKSLVEGLAQMENKPRAGFHPSIALSLFGAIHGEGNLPRQFLPGDFNHDSFLTRAQNEFHSTTSDVANSGGGSP